MKKESSKNTVINKDLKTHIWNSDLGRIPEEVMDFDSTATSVFVQTRSGDCLLSLSEISLQASSLDTLWREFPRPLRSNEVSCQPTRLQKKRKETLTIFNIDDRCFPEMSCDLRWCFRDLNSRCWSGWSLSVLVLRSQRPLSPKLGACHTRLETLSQT